MPERLSIAALLLLCLALPAGLLAQEAGEKEAPPAPEAEAEAPEDAEEAVEEEVSNPAPDFRVKDVAGRERTLGEFKGRIVVLEWASHSCPYVKKHYDCNNMQSLQKSYTGKGVVWLTVCSSGPGRGGHMGPEVWAKVLEKLGASATATLLDEDGKLGHAYGAKKTPHFCIVDKRGSRVYEGAIDDKPRARKAAEIAEAKNYVRLALAALLEDKAPPVARTDAYG